MKIEFSIVFLLNDSAGGRMMAHNRFSRRKMYIPLIMGEKNGLWDQKYYVYCAVYIYRYIYIYIFFLGGGGERVRYEEYGNSSPVPNLYLRSIIINSPLNFLKNVLWLFTIIFLCLFFFIAMRHSCNSPCLLVVNLDRVLALDYDNKSIFPVVSNLSFAVDVDFH